MNEGCNLKSFDEWFEDEIKLHVGESMDMDNIKAIAQQAWSTATRQQWKLQDGYFERDRYSSNGIELF